jgi:nucleoid DNA-binding protein
MEFQDLVIALSDETHYTRREIRRILRVFAKVVREGLSDGLDVKIPGLGRFENVPSAARSGRNASTGERFVIPPSRRVKFVPCDKLRVGVKESVDLFKEESLARRFGLPRKEKKRGEVRSRDRPQEGPEGEEGGSRKHGSASRHQRASRSRQGD